MNAEERVERSPGLRFFRAPHEKGGPEPVLSLSNGGRWSPGRGSGERPPREIEYLSRSRRGLGAVFTLVLGIVFLLCAAGLAFLWCSSSAVSQAIWSARGTLAAHAAESVVEETFAELERDVCDPASPVFRRVRSELLFPSGADLDLSNYYRSVSAFRRFIDGSPDAAAYRGLEMEPPRVVLERAGGSQMLRVEAAALASRVPSSRRAVTQRRYVGITPIAPPSPLDQCTFAILRYDFLETLPKITEETRRLLELYNQLPALMAPWASVATANSCSRPICEEGACCGCLPEACCGCPGAHCHLNPARRSASTWYFDLPQSEFHANLYPCERYAFPIDWVDIPSRTLRDDLLVPADSAIVSTAPAIELEAFDHERTLVLRYEPRIRDLEREAGELNRLVREAIGRTFCKDEHREWNRALMRQGRSMRVALLAAIDVLNEVLKHIHENTRPGLTTAVHPPPRGEQTPAPLAVHAESAARFEQTLAEREAVSGHLAYFGGSTLAVRLEPFRGKAFVSSPPTGAPMRLGPVRLADPDRDRLVLFAPEVVFEGEPVEASVFSLDRTRFLGPPQITGNLILGRLVARSQRSPDEDLRGRVTYDRRVWAGGRAGSADELDGLSLGHFAVGISPRIDQRTLER